MSRLLCDEGGTLAAKVDELIIEPKKPKSEELESFVDVLVDGRLIRERIQLRQESLEEMRPLPISFGSIVDLMAHLLDLGFVTRWPLARSKDREKAQAFRVWYHTHNVETVGRHLGDRLKLELERNWLGPAIHDPDLGIRLDICTSPPEARLIGLLGGGHADLAWGRAWKMVTEGIDGGIRALRHMVIADSIRQDVNDDLQRCYSKLFEAESPCRTRCLERVAAMVLAADPERRRRTVPDVFFFWERTVATYIRALLEELMPAELG